MREDLESKVNELENKMTADGDEQMILQYEKCRSELETISHKVLPSAQMSLGLKKGKNLINIF